MNLECYPVKREPDHAIWSFLLSLFVLEHAMHHPPSNSALLDYVREQIEVQRAVLLEQTLIPRKRLLNAHFLHVAYVDILEAVAENDVERVERLLIQIIDVEKRRRFLH